MAVDAARKAQGDWARTHKKVQLEMGGKNPMVVLDDADLDHAVDVCVNGAFYSTGQRCTASSRLIVAEKVHDEFVQKMIEATASVRVGHALDKETLIGPVIDQSQLDQNDKYVELARKEGCEVTGGDLLERDTP